MNYGELKLLVQSYLHRTDDATVDRIPGYIDAGISRMNGQLRIQEMLAVTTDTPTSNPFTAPSDFLEMRELSREAGTGRCQLVSVSRHELNLYATSGSAPTLYSVDGFLIETRAPATDVEFQLIYYAAIQTPANDTATDTVLTRYPMLWLYSALIEGFSWIQDNEQQSKATDMFVSELDLANRASSVSELGESPKMRGAVQSFI